DLRREVWRHDGRRQLQQGGRRAQCRLAPRGEARRHCGRDQGGGASHRDGCAVPPGVRGQGRPRLLALSAGRALKTMADVRLTFACGLYDRVLPLYTGAVKADGIDLKFINIDSPREIFDRMSAEQEFDVSEYSSSEFISRFAAKQCP